MLVAFRWAGVAAVAAVLGSVMAAAHEGHDHASAPAVIVGAAPRAEAVSDNFELVAVARAGALSIFLDRFKTNEPVPNAEITVETPAGSVQATPADGGSYTVAAPWSERAGKYDLIFTVSADGVAEVLLGTIEIGAAAAGDGARLASRWPAAGPLSLAVLAALGGILVGAGVTAWLGRGRLGATAAILAVVVVACGADAFAHDDHEHGATPSAPSPREAAQRATDGSLFVPKSTQRLLAIRTEIVASAAYRRTLELPGRVIPDPNASGLVQASAGGRLSPPPGGFPRLGARVAKGDVLAYVTTPLQSIDRSDMRQRQGELDQQISIVERRIARYETLVAGRRRHAGPARRGAARTAGAQGPPRRARSVARRTGSPGCASVRVSSPTSMRWPARWLTRIRCCSRSSSRRGCGSKR